MRLADLEKKVSLKGKREMAYLTIRHKPTNIGVSIAKPFEEINSTDFVYLTEIWNDAIRKLGYAVYDYHWQRERKLGKAATKSVCSICNEELFLVLYSETLKGPIPFIDDVGFHIHDSNRRKGKAICKNSHEFYLESNQICGACGKQTRPDSKPIAYTGSFL